MAPPEPTLLLRYQWNADGSEVHQRVPLKAKFLQSTGSKVLDRFRQRWNNSHPTLALRPGDVELAHSPVGPHGAIPAAARLADQLPRGQNCQLFVRRLDEGGSWQSDAEFAVDGSASLMEATVPRSLDSAPAATPSATRKVGCRKPKNAASAGAGGVDYSKWNVLEDSDDEALVPSSTVSLPLGMPPKAVSREEYNKVWATLLSSNDLPCIPAPDLDQMYGYYKYGGTDEQALLDQACEFLGKLQIRIPVSEWKAKTHQMLMKMEAESRVDEARMWSVLQMCRFPDDADALYNHGVLLTKLCDRAKFGGAPRTRLPNLDGSSTMVPTESYCAVFARAAQLLYRRCLRVDPKHRGGFINLIGSLERNEPDGWYDQVHELAVRAVRNGIWYNKWQRPPHFVPQLPSRPWHSPSDFALCEALEAHATIVSGEYAAYVQRLANRRTWDDSDPTPGPSAVGARDGALHDGGLRKEGDWREVPLFANSSLQRDYASCFPETVRILQRHCADAVGLALCGGGDIIFSVLTPGTRLRPHCGPSNARLTCHLGIQVPRRAEQGLTLRVGPEPARGWHEGQCLVFDDSYEHEVRFDEVPGGVRPGDRVVLLLNFWHPDFRHKNDPAWREKSDGDLAHVAVETLPQTALLAAS